MVDISKYIVDNSSVIQSTSGTIASIGLAKIGKSVAGNLVAPAVWVLNYAAQRKTPDGVDVGLYIFAFTSSLAAPAAITTGLVKSAVDDDTARKLREVQSGIEIAAYRPYIIPCSTYSYSSPLINAMTIASKGGTAWQHPNGLWVYLIDASGKLVVDFEPKIAINIYQANLPLQPTKRGGFHWSSIR